MKTAQSKQNCSRARQITTLVLQGVNQLLWPAVCLNCGQSICESDKNLCRDCWDQLLMCTAGDYCPRCGRDVSIYALIDDACPDCQGDKTSFDGIARSGVYSQSLRDMILAFKNGRTDLDLVLGLLADSALQGSRFINKVDFFVPVPLHWSRWLVRGYNQSQIIAKKLKHSTAVISTDLVRIRRTKSQAAMATPAQRKANVAGAFAVRRGHKFDGKAICLIDDIKTTGATLNECAKVLKEAGAAKVFALVLAVAGQNIS